MNRTILKCCAYFYLFIQGSGRAFVEVPSSSGSGGVGGGSGGGLPTAALIALPVGAVAVLALVGWVIYYVKSERRMKARKEVGGPHHQQLQRHHQRDIGSKDLSLTVPCLPRQEPPQPPHSESGMPMHHRLQPIHPIQQHQPATCMPYSVRIPRVYYSSILFCYSYLQTRNFNTITVFAQLTPLSCVLFPFPERR